MPSSNSDAALSSPRHARAWTRQILREWQLAGLADDAEAIIAELAANAVHASAGLKQPAIRLALAFDHGELLILVSDGNPALPQAQHPAADAESGRGLLMVEALSNRYGWYPPRRRHCGQGGVGGPARPPDVPATTPPASPSKAPASPENDQPDHRRGPLLGGRPRGPSSDERHPADATALGRPQAAQTRRRRSRRRGCGRSCPFTARTAGTASGRRDGQYPLMAPRVTPAGARAAEGIPGTGH